MSEICDLCRRNPRVMIYEVERGKPKNLCGECNRKHPPRVLDQLLGVKQPYYGDGKDPEGTVPPPISRL